MVQIFIKNDQTSIADWSLIELQGDLESKFKTTLAGCFMGDLHYTLNGSPILIIGHHVLYGQVIELDKPFAVLFKEKAKLNDASAETESDEKMETSTVSCTEYLVRAIIRKKLVFKTRPKPIVTNVAKKL